MNAVRLYRLSITLLLLITPFLIKAQGIDLGGLSSISGLGGFNQPATQVTLLSDHETAAPGSTVTLGLQMVCKPGWDTYWRNPGDVGSPTKIQWQSLPQGITVSKIQWTVPEKGVLVGSPAYYYTGTNILTVSVTVGSEASEGEITLSGKANWLECSDKQCVPRNTDISVTFTIGEEAKPSNDYDLLKSWNSKIPQVATDAKVSAEWLTDPDEKDRRELRIDWEATTEAPYIDFYPYVLEDQSVEWETIRTNLQAGTISLIKKVISFDKAWPKAIQGILVTGEDDHHVESAIEVTIPIQGDDFSPAPEATDVASLPIDQAEEKSLFAWIWFAFLGGLILNIMPCVLPVISLKILSFVNQSQEAPGQVKKLGLVFTLGVLVSFLVLALIVVAMKLAGGSPTWGQQFQNPVFVICMTILVLLIGLNLFGLFEVSLGGNMMTNASKLTRKEGPAGAFFNGMLVTLLATPCTAPFLGSAVAFAFTQPAAVIILVFLMVGFGMAAPYLLLSFNPSLLKYIPKPGPWMDHFKVFMGFPMIAVVVWLGTVASQLIYEDSFGSQFWVGMVLLCITIAAWIFGKFIQQSMSKQKGIPLLIIIFFLGVAANILEKSLNWRSPDSYPVFSGTINEFPSSTPDKLEWVPWSPETEQAAIATGRPVFIDFTATWCGTCKWNKLNSIDIAPVREKLAQANAILLRGDHTAQDPRITEILYKHQRAGVPLNLYYPGDKQEAPVVLPERIYEDTMLGLFTQ